jgi:hypothetical protein
MYFVHCISPFPLTTVHETLLHNKLLAKILINVLRDSLLLTLIYKHISQKFDTLPYKAIIFLYIVFVNDILYVDAIFKIYARESQMKT